MSLKIGCHQIFRYRLQRSYIDACYKSDDFITIGGLHTRIEKATRIQEVVEQIFKEKITGVA